MIFWSWIFVSIAQAGEAIGATSAVPATLGVAPETPAGAGGYASIVSAVVSTVVATVIAFERISDWKGKSESSPPSAPPPIVVPPSSPISPEMLARLNALDTRIGAIEKTTETIRDNEQNASLSLARMEGQIGAFSERLERMENLLTKAIFRRDN